MNEFDECRRDCGCSAENCLVSRSEKGGSGKVSCDSEKGELGSYFCGKTEFYTAKRC